MYINAVQNKLTKKIIVIITRSIPALIQHTNMFVGYESVGNIVCTFTCENEIQREC